MNASAPPAARLVVGLVNSRAIHHDLRGLREDLASPRELAAWLRDHLDLPEPPATTSADLETAVVLREGLRAVLAGHNDARLPEDDLAEERLESVATGLLLRVAFDGGAPALVPVGTGHARDALAELLAQVVRAGLDDDAWRRLKVCRAPDCREAFVDESRNRSRAWCSMSVCGGRAKQRAFAARQRSGGA